MEAYAMSRCPLCSSADLHCFAQLRNSPLLQNIFFDSEEEALAAPRLDVDFQYCPACHFAFNPAFDDTAVKYSNLYNNNQTESPAYRKYIDGITDDLIRHCALDFESRILEIACGNGYFLSCLRRKLNSAAIVGYDPAYAGQHGMRDYIHNRYFEATPGQTFGLIVLRHCFESLVHYSDVLKALTVSLHDNGRLYIEATNLDYIIKTRDLSLLFHEYHRYYSSTAMARLLNLHGLVIQRCAPLFGGQYLGVIAARRRAPEGLETGHAPLVEALTRFRKVAIWGISGRAISFLSHMNLRKDRVPIAVDTDKSKQGKHIPVTGQKIISPEAVNALEPDLIIVSNSNYLNEIRGQCRFSTTFMTLDGQEA